MADVYRVKADTTFPKVVRVATSIDGVPVAETLGESYSTGDFLYGEDLTERDQERLKNGELDHLLEKGDEKEAEAWFASDGRSTFIPEHEVERYVLLDAGHQVVERDQVLELRSAGADAQRAALEASRESGADQRPQVTEQASFVEVSGMNEPEPVLPKDAEEVPLSVVEQSGVEMPPGLPVGPTLAKAAGADPEEVDSETEKSAKRASRKRPSSSGSDS